MSRDYPHLHDTPFPRVDTVDAYSYANNEDYAVLSEKGNAKLLAVPWSADYLETVGFESDAERDAWFADAPGRSLALTDTMCRVPAETVAVPVPYGDAVVYNYIVIDKPTPPVDYATDGGITRYGNSIGASLRISCLSEDITRWLKPQCRSISKTRLPIIPICSRPT